MGIAGACALSCRFGTISKGEIAVENIVESCTLCPRHCGSYRGEREGRGFCRMGTWPVVARAALHMWEEPCISGTEGSGTIFFSGCSLGCVFCQNTCISTEHSIGEAISVQRLQRVWNLQPSGGCTGLGMSPSRMRSSLSASMSVVGIAAIRASVYG